MAQRVRIPYRGWEALGKSPSPESNLFRVSLTPSSATQLPITAALHARFPTLFPDIIHEIHRIVNSFFTGSLLFYQTVVE